MPEPTVIVPKQVGMVGGVHCALSTRRGGVPGPFEMNLSHSVGDDPFRVNENRKRFFSSQDIPIDRLAIPRQCHSSTVHYAAEPGSFDETDGLITDKMNVWLVVSTADCTPVFVYERKKRAVGAFHAGWRGSSDGIVSFGVKKMVEEIGCDSDEMFAYVGPAAGACCYEVGSEVAERFHSGVISNREGKYFMDLKKENHRQLMESGIPEHQIEISSECTICNPLFHSFRRDKERSGRMMGVIGLKG